MNESQIEEMQQSRGVEDILRERITELEEQLDRSMRTAELHTEASKTAHTRYFELSAKYTQAVQRIAELEGALEDIAVYATTESPVTQIINAMLNKKEK